MDMDIVSHLNEPGHITNLSNGSIFPGIICSHESMIIYRSRNRFSQQIGVKIHRIHCWSFIRCSMSISIVRNACVNEPSCLLPIWFRFDFLGNTICEIQCIWVQVHANSMNPTLCWMENWFFFVTLSQLLWSRRRNIVAQSGALHLWMEINFDWISS